MAGTAAFRVAVVIVDGPVTVEPSGALRKVVTFIRVGEVGTGAVRPAVVAVIAAGREAVPAVVGGR